MWQSLALPVRSDSPGTNIREQAIPEGHVLEDLGVHVDADDEREELIWLRLPRVRPSRHETGWLPASISDCI
jgi:hypothetical protein